MKLSSLLIVVMAPLLIRAGEPVKSGHGGKERPNIIVLLTDDQSYYTLKAAGNTVVKSPHLDSLVGNGVLFSRHYSTTAICMASRATLLTGKLEYKTGTNFMHGAMQRKIFSHCYPVLLRKSGYVTGFAGKFGFAVTDSPDSDEEHNDYDRLPVEDFDWWTGGVGQTSYETARNTYLKQYAGRYPHSTRAYGRAACDFIEKAMKDGKPFCLSLFFKAPHMPFTPDPVFDSVYRDVTFPVPPNFGKANAAHLPVQSRLGRQNSRWSSWWNEENHQESSRKYYQLIYGVDYALGMIKSKLKEAGIWEKTIIIFTSDNGYNMGAHGLGDKVLGYEEGSKVPLVISDPVHGRAMKGKVSAVVSGNFDLAPTILEMAGIPIPAGMDGVSLLPVVRGQQLNGSRAVPLIQAWGSAPTLSMGVLWNNWKYLYWPYADGMEAAEELYDTRSDPFEMRNVMKEHPAVLKEMRKRYDQEVRKWKKQAVTYNNYACFGIIFDRNVSWPEKKKQIPEAFFSFYETDLREAGITSQPYDYSSVLKEIELKYK